jgi:hypothetical protein
VANAIDALPQHQNFLTGNYTGFLEKLASRFSRLPERILSFIQENCVQIKAR